MGRALSGCLCQPLADSRGHLALATPNVVLNAVVGSCPSVTLSPAWMKHFVVTVLNGLDRHVPQEKQLPKASPVHLLWGRWTQPLCSIWVPKVIEGNKAHADRQCVA